MNLENLKDDELEQSFHRAASSERKIMHIVILHVQEVSRRKLYLARGYGSLKNYLIEVLKYSGPSAQRQIEAAKLVTAVPSLSEKLEAGQINLSQIGERHRAIGLAEKTHHEKITESAKAEIIEKVAGQNVIATQQICADFFDVPVVESQRVKTRRTFRNDLNSHFLKSNLQSLSRSVICWLIRTFKRSEVSRSPMCSKRCLTRSWKNGRLVPSTLRRIRPPAKPIRTSQIKGGRNKGPPLRKCLWAI